MTLNQNIHWKNATLSNNLILFCHRCRYILKYSIQFTINFNLLKTTLNFVIAHIVCTHNLTSCKHSIVTTQVTIHHHTQCKYILIHIFYLNGEKTWRERKLLTTITSNFTKIIICLCIIFSILKYKLFSRFIINSYIHILCVFVQHFVTISFILNNRTYIIFLFECIRYYIVPIYILTCTHTLTY